MALKLFYSTDPTVLSSLLERELSALRAIRHDRIPPVLDWSTDPHSPFVVFPYYAAGSLADFIAVNGSLSTVNAIRLLHDVLSALVAAHRACLLHLDIKPHNVLLDGTGGYMLADFGVAQGSFVAQYGICMGLGTIGFQSPEQLDYSSGEFDARVDIWGVGITAWAAVTGVTQQTIRNLRLQNIANDHALPAPSQIGAVCPPELERLIMSMLYHDRGKRPAGASEVLSLVRSLALDGEKRSESAIKLCDLKVYGSAETAAAASELMDPIWKSILATQQLSGNIVEYDDGVTILEEGEESYNAFVLLKGAYEIFRDGRLLACEDREGSFLGEITALAGERRTATARAKGRTRLLSLNAAEFEHFLARNPAITMRLLKTLAARIHQASETEDRRKRPL